MRTFAVLGVATALLCAAHAAASLVARDGRFITREFVAEVNKLNKGIWTARYDTKMARLTRQGVKRLMGAKLRDAPVLPRRHFTEEELRAPLPESFDAATAWPDCPTIKRIADQSSCGSCWAVAAATAMSDRFCVTGGVRDLGISAGDLLSCCTSCGDGCDGGYPDEAWLYFTESGLVSDYCQPYPFPPCKHSGGRSKNPSCHDMHFHTPKCNATCTDKRIPVVRYFASESYSLQGEEDYKRELYLRGPFEVAFTVYEDFLAYESGVYKHVSGGPVGGHAVRVVGWGERNGVPYWKIANSWNTDWGENGYLYFYRGKDECGIESQGSAGTPSGHT
ncbi:putative Papain family cysteine protease [Trypanosoma vivax]|uniref:Cysteine peptidase C (CPC) n=1 Tax=Trypanosoma vivax (strain Y486) TaxID=1055687 RepID=G0TW77_TRYVY|nr:putative Papain family cysteine protease [Trypanosoma vivax]CCC48215.1 cysteine peptidase C (CPC) [Trypanosoma vivax Y486]KAH8619626.1 putative Papain family cysteine protease [Trypanosoma vivax]KAH8619648.1 putative Papain family cysteine protease [Trypanosoma vivax]KAH8619673.1 putative Papain family cysteine protease [Trypanosoma vivax]